MLAISCQPPIPIPNPPTQHNTTQHNTTPFYRESPSDRLAAGEKSPFARRNDMIRNSLSSLSTTLDLSASATAARLQAASQAGWLYVCFLVYEMRFFFKKSLCFVGINCFSQIIWEPLMKQKAMK
jgi:hypothetical protein